MASSSLKQLPSNLSAPLLRRRPPVLPPSLTVSIPRLHPLKALHLSSSPKAATSLSLPSKPRRGFACSAADLDPLSVSVPTSWEEKVLDFLLFYPSPCSLRRWSITFFLTTLYYCTYIIYCKMMLNAFPFPLFVSALSLLGGSLCMIAVWNIPRMPYKWPKPDHDFWQSLFPIAVVHTIGLVAEMVSLSKMSISFAQITRGLEPVFFVFLSTILGRTFPVPLYLSLAPIIGGCALAAHTELNFTVAGFVAAMIANLAFAARNILLERVVKEKGNKVTDVNYFACLCIMSTMILAPFTLVLEGPRMWAASWEMACLKENGMIPLVGGLPILYYLFNDEFYKSFPNVEPFRFLTVNTTKKIFAIVSSIICLGGHLQPTNALGAAIVILGILLYSRELCKTSRLKSWHL